MHQACQSARWIKTPNKSISYCFSGYRRVLETEEFSPKEQRVFFTGMRSDAIIHNAPKLAQDGAGKLDPALEGGPPPPFPGRQRKVSGGPPPPPATGSSGTQGSRGRSRQAGK